MSEFDKEAEREKLREKYEAEQAEREATQQMSELLLQGATMTNHHCDRCGNPIFRYEGQEFCPHCQQADQEAARQAEDGAQADESGAEGQSGSQTQETPQDQGTAQETPQGEGTAQPQETPQDQRTTQPQESPQDQASPPEREAGTAAPDDRQDAGSGTAREDPVDREGVRRHVSPTEAGSRVADAGDDPTSPDRGTADADAGDLSEGAAALRRTLTKFARRAEATDDPREAKECLAAAREAAEALSALRR